MSKLGCITALTILLVVTVSEAATPLFLSAITSALATIPLTGGPMSTGLVGAKLGIGTKLLYYLGYFGRSASRPKAKSAPKKSAPAKSAPKPSGMKGAPQFPSGLQPLPLPYALSGGSPQMGGMGGGFGPASFQQPPMGGGFDPSQVFQALRAQGFDANTAMQMMNYGGGFGPNAGFPSGGGGFGPNAGFPSGGGGFGPNAGFPSGGGFAPNAGFPSGGGFAPNAGFPTGGGGFDPNAGFSPNMPQGAGFPPGFPPSHDQGPGFGTVENPPMDESPPDVHDDSFSEGGGASEDVESFFTFLKDMDENGCISRLMCDIGANPSFLGDFSENIHGIVSTLDVQPSSGAYPYIQIVEGGREGGCDTKFPQCSDAAYEIVKSVAPSVGVPQNINSAAINNL